MTKTRTRIIWISIRKKMYMTKTHKNIDSHSYKDVHDKNPFQNKCIVIRTDMCMTKTHSKRIWILIRTEMCMTKTHMNMDSHLYRNVHDKNPYKKNMDSHLYRNVHDENPYTKKWIVIRTEMCMTKTHSQENG